MLPVVYCLGWLPALGGAAWAAPTATGGVLSAAGADATVGVAGLALTLAILTAAYVAALRRPPATRVLLLTATASIAAALCMPVLFSADSYAYAYYGDRLVHRANPYAHQLPAQGDPLVAAAVAAWGGRLPPRCVYGPVAVAIAAAADLVGAAGGVAAQLAAQRLAAAAAYALYAAALLRLVRGGRARAACLLNPTVIWSVAEGHNDAAMLALVVAGLAAGQARPPLLALAALVKAPALATWGRLAGWRERASAAALTTAGYLPLALTVWSDRAPVAPTGGAQAWQSPLGMLAATVGWWPAVAGVAGALAAGAWAARRCATGDRASAFALTAWFALPNAYPWYALWIVPLAARNVTSLWSRALLVAAACAPARAMLDAVYPAADRSGATGFHLPFIAAEYLPPLVAAAVAFVRRPRTGALAAAGIIFAAFAALAVPGAAGAQGSAPGPLPACSPSDPAPAPNLGPASAAPTPTAAPSPTASASGILAPRTAAPAATSNPFGYIITPPPVPTATPDGPHILQVELNDKRIRAGGPLVVRVITSANVVGVEARALGRFIAIPQSSPGLFALAYTLPSGIPFWLLNRNYDIVIAAATADGRQTSVSFPLILTP